MNLSFRWYFSLKGLIKKTLALFVEKLFNDIDVTWIAELRADSLKAGYSLLKVAPRLDP